MVSTWTFYGLVTARPMSIEMRSMETGQVDLVGSASLGEVPVLTETQSRVQ